MRVFAFARPRLSIIAILHGDLSNAIGWRSRDPRHRMFDHRSAVRAAIWSGVRVVVLEKHIKRAAVEHALVPESRCDVWPLPIADTEQVPNPTGVDRRETTYRVSRIRKTSEGVR